MIKFCQSLTRSRLLSKVSYLKISFEGSQYADKDTDDDDDDDDDVPEVITVRGEARGDGAGRGLGGLVRLLSARPDVQVQVSPRTRNVSRIHKYIKSLSYLTNLMQLVPGPCQQDDS